MSLDGTAGAVLRSRSPVASQSALHTPADAASGVSGVEDSEVLAESAGERRHVAAAVSVPRLASITSFDPKIIEVERRQNEVIYELDMPHYVGWLSHPYAISIGIAAASVVVFSVFSSSAVESDVWDTQQNFRYGVYAALAVYFLVAACNFRDTVMLRPHPVFWRLIKGAAFLYLFGLVWLFFQNVNDARSWLRYWDPKLGVPIVYKSYAEACDLYTPGHPGGPFFNLTDAVFDTFTLAHLVGWFCKTLMLRDLRLTVAASILFELYELTFRHMLPNFNECWWDSIILDLLLANLGGIVLGTYFMKVFRVKQYNFFGMLGEGNEQLRKEDAELVASGKRVWKPLVRFRFFFAPLVVLASIAAIELNAFFLKYILWTPPSHGLNFWRVMFWWLLGCAGTREFYHWMQRPKAPLGMMISLIFVNASMEALICAKFGRGMFAEPMPQHIKIAWLAVFAALALFAAIYYPVQHIRRQLAQQQKQTAAEGAPPPTLQESVAKLFQYDTATIKE